MNPGGGSSATWPAPGPDRCRGIEIDPLYADTRPGRVGLTVGKWFLAEAQKHGRFDAELVDLAAVNLPMYNEPRHPIMQQYEHQATKNWASMVAAAEAYAFVTPEYNFGPPPALVNALNYVYKEWNYKAAGFISYGGISGAVRAVQMEKSILTTLKVVPLAESVVIPMVAQSLDAGEFRPNDIQTQAAAVLLNELGRWADALKPLRG